MNPVAELRGSQASDLPTRLSQATRPFVMRGILRQWPAVQAALDSPRALATMLLQHWQGAPVGLWEGAPSIQGQFGYNKQLQGLNFEKKAAPFDEVLRRLTQQAGDPRRELIQWPALYVGSTTLETLLPGFSRTHPIELGGVDPLASIWLGNRTCVAAHFDVPDNLACVVAGRRRFTLFPPDQVHNLYVGPWELTPAGQPISLVDVTNPDLERFPRFAAAAAAAEVAELEPGDAIFIPSLWWHHVQAQDHLNVLINYWWREGPAQEEAPLMALMAAMLTLRQRPSHERAAWRALFDHYCFADEADRFDHLPLPARGILGPHDADTARMVRRHVSRRFGT